MLLALVALAAPASAQEIGAIVRPDAEIDLAPDREGEDAAAIRTRVRAWARGETGRDGTWFLEVRGVNEILVGPDVRYDVDHCVGVSGDCDTIFTEPGLEGVWFGEIGESGWEGQLAGPVRLRVGNLVERWGKLDLLPIVDVLNPRDLRFGLNQPTEFQRIPVPMATVSVGSDVIRSETTVLPFAVQDRISLRGTDWSYLRDGLIERQVRDVETWEGGASASGDALFIPLRANANLGPSYRRAMDAATLEKNTPQDTFLHPEIAQRLVVHAKDFDLAVMGSRIHSRQPLASVHPVLQSLLQQEALPDLSEMPVVLEAQTDLIQTSWPMTWTAGLEAGTVVGPLGIRAEAGWMSDKVVRLQWGGAGLTPSAAAGLGLDYVRGSSLQIGVEARYERLLSSPSEALAAAKVAGKIGDYPAVGPDPEAGEAPFAPPEPAFLFTRDQSLQLAGGVRWSVMAERVQIQLGGTYDVVFREWMALPKLTYRVDDHLQVDVGALLLGGPTKPPERLRDAMTYDGGLLGYFGQNDALTFGVSWIL